jgi:hypothetical protein
MESPPPQAAPTDSTMEEEKQTEEAKADTGAAKEDKGAGMSCILEWVLGLLYLIPKLLSTCSCERWTR